MLLILGTGLAIGPLLASLVMNVVGPVALFIVTATFPGALAVTAFLRMKIRPVREGGRMRFRVMNAEKGVTPGTVTLDPRADENAEVMAPTAPAPAPPAGRDAAEMPGPDPDVPEAVAPGEPKSDQEKPDVQN
jgi:hypothetical protein